MDTTQPFCVPAFAVKARQAEKAREYRTGLANAIAAAGLLSCGALVILWYVVMWVGE
jgi:Flp pilus assembly protein TadB